MGKPIWDIEEEGKRKSIYNTTQDQFIIVEEKSHIIKRLFGIPLFRRSYNGNNDIQKDGKKNSPGFRTVSD